MQKKNTTYTLLAIAFVIAAAGFLLPFWPLEVLGVLILALSGHWLWGVFVGLLLDIAYGAPTGHFHVLLFPFTILALASALAYRFGRRYFFDASRQDTL